MQQQQPRIVQELPACSHWLQSRLAFPQGILREQAERQTRQGEDSLITSRRVTGAEEGEDGEEGRRGDVVTRGKNVSVFKVAPPATRADECDGDGAHVYAHAAAAQESIV